MKKLEIETINHLDLANIKTLVFSGRGKRCWWQVGIMQHWLESGWRLPVQLIGTSAGAAIAASAMTTGPLAALDACSRLYSVNQRMFEWRNLLRLKMEFAHAHIYPAWISTFINRDTFYAYTAFSILTLRGCHPSSQASGIGWVGGGRYLGIYGGQVSVE